MISHLDHLVLTTDNEAASVDFYTRLMGMALETFIGGTPPVERKAFSFGRQKINVHVSGSEFAPKADSHNPRVSGPLLYLQMAFGGGYWAASGMPMAKFEGPAIRTGATGRIQSIDVRGPDGNLIEISEPIKD